MFTWKPIYSELATALLAWRDRQSELIAILLAAKEQGVPVSTLKDEDKSGKKVPLQVMDPFTFFGFFNRKIKPQHRIKLLSLVKDKFGLTSSVPEDFTGIPIMFPQRTWFFSYESHREPHAIDTLWDFAQAIVEQAPEAVPPDLFAKTLALKQVALPNLTMGMFWMRPDQYLAVDKRNRAFLKNRGIEPNITDWKSYLEFLNQVKSKIPGLSWSELSKKAYQTGGGGPLPEKRHWLFQANPQYFDLVGSLKAGALQTWQVNQHRKEIHSGDRVILWQSGNAAGVYGLATVTSEVGELTESPEEAAFHSGSTKSSDPFIGVTLRIDSAFCDTPIRKEDLPKQKHTKDLPIGRQGTNFLVTEKQFNAVEKLIPSGNENRRYWIYAPGEGARFWKECLDKRIMVIGYDELEDFRAFKSQEEIEKRLKTILKLKNSPHNHSRAVWEFTNVMQPGDVVIAKEGRGKYLGFGIVQGPYDLDLSRPEFKSLRQVTWMKTGSWNADSPIAIKTLTDVTRYQEYVKYLRKLLGITLEGSPQPPPCNPVPLSGLNTILYGPPGTGKTFNTIERAVRTIEPQFTGDHRAHKARFDELRRKGQIEFITLHQSYSYEDFVEGLRPVTDPEEESTQARYHYCAGVFKRVAVQAMFDCLKPTSPDAGAISFDAVWNKLVEQIELDPERSYPGLTEKAAYRISLTPRGNLEGINTISNKNFLCPRSILEKVYAAKPKGKSISSSEVMEIVVRGCHSHFIAAVFNELKRLEKSLPSVKQAPPAATFSWEQKAEVVQAFLNGRAAEAYALKSDTEWPRYVLVVDEINRGNVSKILGELITLIESDKRVGAEHWLTVQLPYTHEYFAVPGNLHIIGTMNTADKSIALVDVALRRRFQFEELRPNFGHCKSLTPQMSEALQALNRRICLRKDRDHQVGHSYFMAVSNEAEFNRVFDKHVIPLLQEYFYNDWEGLRFVLGEHKTGSFIKPLDGCDGAEARTKWQWASDANNGAVNCLQALLANYQTA
jgi:hypothetical protein